MLTRASAAVLMLAMTAWPSLAEDIPYAGMAYNTKENNAVQYTCTKNGDLLDCDFVQTRVRPKAGPGDLAKSIAEMKKQFAADPKQLAENSTCKQVDKMIGALDGTVPLESVPEMAEGIGSMTEFGKRDLLVTMSAIKNACDNPSEAAFIKVAKAAYSVESRTCVVSANPYSQQFRKLPGSEVWVVAQDGPQGECGMINVSRFEKDEGSKYALWNYFAKKVVTNKSAVLALGMKCSEFDEGEYKFSWMSRTIQQTCDYIEYSPL